MPSAMGFQGAQDMAWTRPEDSKSSNGKYRSSGRGSGSWDGGDRGGGSSDGDGFDRMMRQLNRMISGSSGGTVLLALLAALTFWGLLGFYQLDQQERAVVLRFGKYHDLVMPGLRWNPWLIDRVHKVNVTKVYSESYSGHMLTRDENIVMVRITVQYQIAGPREFVLNVRSPLDSLRDAMESALRHVVGGSVIDEVITYGREAVGVQVHDRLQNYLDLYDTGIRVARTNINEATPPQEVKAAFDDVNKALEDEARYINEAEAYANEVVPRARGMAKRALEEAEGYRQRVIARAQGEANRFNQLLKEYRQGESVMRERLYLEAVEDVLRNTSKILVDSEGGSNQLLYLPLDQLMQQTRTGKDLRQPSDVSSVAMDEDVLNELARRISSRLGAQQRRTR